MKRVDKNYAKFIKSQPCLVTGGDSTGHHVRTLGNCGTGCKPPDYYRIPIDPELHIEDLHRHGEQAFYDKHFINPEIEIIRLLAKYIGETHE